MIKYSKTRIVKSPTRGSITNDIFADDRSAGIDFYVPEFSREFVDALNCKNTTKMFYNDKTILIPAHSHILIPSGICCNLAMNEDYIYDKHHSIALIAFNKSKIGVRQLDVAATVIDEDYQGEIHISLTNTSKYAVSIEYGEKIVQFLLVPIILSDFVETVHDELFNYTSKRSIGAFGSTGTK